MQSFTDQEIIEWTTINKDAWTLAVQLLGTGKDISEIQTLLEQVAKENPDKQYHCTVVIEALTFVKEEIEDLVENHWNQIPLRPEILAREDPVAKGGRKGNFTDDIKSLLLRWLVDHLDHPYLEPKDKEDLAQKTGLEPKQIGDWFSNARRRIVPGLLEMRSDEEASKQLKKRKI